MQFKLFQYALHAEPKLDELNQFLAQHRVVSVQKEVVQCRGEPQLVFIVEVSGAEAKEADGQKAPRIDYRERMNEDDFRIFCQLRDCRKALAEAEGVPLFSVFTNAQLATMVTERYLTVDKIASLPNVGDLRVSKYSDAVLAVLKQAFGSDATESKADDSEKTNPS